MEKVFLSKITADSDNDAYAIFETMNDRGLPLTPAEMLKSYLLANITDEKRRTEAKEAWEKQARSLHEWEEEEAIAIKAWLRGQYAQTIREGGKELKTETSVSSALSSIAG